VKLPRDLSGQRVVRALVRLGFVQERRVGSHIRLARNGLRVTVPNHPTLAPKTLQSILRQAQLTSKSLRTRSEHRLSDKFKIQQCSSPSGLPRLLHRLVIRVHS